jgi:pyruvate formate lyase activating enzyme
LIKTINYHSTKLTEMKSSKSGIVFDIQRFALHDGPGIRTTVFFKGCPLSCWWCHNPEGQATEPEIIFWENRCIGCESCLKVCSNSAISRSADSLLTDKGKCTLCGNCTEVCPSGAREIIGRKVSVSKVIEEIEKDIIFYDQSGGGVTFSGGEPLMQPDFLDELLVCCKEKEIHRTVDTCGFAETETLLKIARNVDLFLYDLKLMDDHKHKSFTGVSNELILRNLKELALHHKNIIIRMPIIPEINDDDKNTYETGEFVTSLKAVKQIDLLPYNELSIEKHKRLKRPYSLLESQSLSDERINEIAENLKRFGLKVKIRR